MSEVEPVVLVAAALLSIPARKIRALARGDHGALRDWISNESATRLAEARRDARAVMRRVESARATVVAMTDARFPAALLELPDPPPFLVVEGTLPLAPAGGAGTAIVGTRTPSPGGERYAFDLARHAAGPIVSGLALGIDAAAHRGALAAGRPTVAYVAHGLGETYPPEHGDLARAIVAAGGAIASERLPGERVSRWSLVRRDRLQAGHARAVVLVESEAGGGAMHALRVARELGRARFARIPQSSDPAAADDAERGNFDALADGALPLESDAAAAAFRLRRDARGNAETPARHGAVLPLWKDYDVNATFEPFDLERAKTLTGGDLDALPFGVIVVDRSGTILEYNSYESDFAGMSRERVMGRNFFHDVAPCTAIREFEGRFVAWLDSAETSIEPFQFVFPFVRGAQQVSVIFVRTAFDSTRATICVVRRPGAPVGDGQLDL